MTNDKWHVEVSLIPRFTRFARAKVIDLINCIQPNRRISITASQLHGALLTR